MADNDESEGNEEVLEVASERTGGFGGEGDAAVVDSGGSEVLLLVLVDVRLNGEGVLRVVLALEEEGNG